MVRTLALLFCLVQPLASWAGQDPASQPAAGEVREIAFSVKGLVCSFCANGLVSTLEREAGVAKARVDLKERLVYVYMRPNAALDEEKLRSLVRDAGFEMGQLKAR